MTAFGGKRDQCFRSRQPVAALDPGRSCRPAGAFEPARVDVGDRRQAWLAARKERQQLAALSLRTLLRHRLGEAEWRGDRDRGSGVAAREFLEKKGVQHGRLLKRAEFGAGNRLNDTQRPDRTDQGRRQRRRFVRGPRRRRHNGAGEVGGHRARNFLILGEREGDHGSERVFEGPMSACIG